MYRRYAIYLTPDGALAKVGAAWLGWDIESGREIPHPTMVGMDLPAMTMRPRRYGLHATIKPPMVLAEGRTQAEFISAAGHVASSLPQIEIEGLHVSRIGRFLALTPVGPDQLLNELAAQIVELLDPFRAPPTEEELNRRRQRPLTQSQEQNLMQWGYPNVMADFRFHITLTGPLKNLDHVEPIVTEYFAPVLPSPFTINHLTVVGEDADGRFHAIARLPLADRL